MTTSSGRFVLPCTCKIWSDKGNGLKQMRQAVNELCKERNLEIVCLNVSASVTHEVLNDLVGAWAMEITGSDGACLAEDSPDLQRFLWMINGEVLGVCPDFVWVSVVHNHSHRGLVQLV